MTVDQLRAFFMWCSMINAGFLFLWWAMIALASGWIYRVHTRWFPMTREEFSVAHYRGIMYFKAALFLFNVVPFVALLIVG